MKRGKIWLVVALAAAMLVTTGAAQATGGSMQCDFDGDGYDDLAVGVPYEAVGAATGAGAVNVIYGSPDRLITPGNQIWHQDVSGIDDVAESGDLFGSAIECGNFNGDMYADLAIGVMGEEVDSFSNAGAFHILYGSASGLSATDSQFFDRNSPGVAGQPEANDRFGSSLAAGDFDGDGDDDLAVGAMYDNIPGFNNAGTVQVFKATAGGISTGGDKIWHLGTPGIKGDPAAFDNWGKSIATGDINNDGFDDLVAGNPYDDTDGTNSHGSFSVIFGSSNGLKTGGDQLFDRGTRGVKGPLEAFANFGRTVAVGDVNGDGYDDVAIAAPNADVGGDANAGNVQLMFGGPNGVKTGGDKVVHRDTAGIRGLASANDNFGGSLTIARFNGDAYADLAIGVPFDDVSTFIDVGSVHVIYGSSTGLTGAGDQIWHQDKKSVLGTNENSDLFGYSVAAGDFNGNGKYDLVIGIPLEDGTATTDNGKVGVLYGRSAKITAKGDQTFSQDTPGIEGAIESGDRFGNSVSGNQYDFN